MNFLNNLTEVMAKNDIFPKGTIDPFCKKVQRFKHASLPKKGEIIFLFIHLDQNGNPAGATFGDWRNREEFVTWWNVKDKNNDQINIEEKAKRKILREEAIRIETYEKELLKNKAIHLATQEWNNSVWAIEKDPPHPYLKTKRILPYEAKITKDERLMIPIHDSSNKIQSYQYISNDGFKKFVTNTSFKDGSLQLGKVLNQDLPIRICEGYATGCSIYEVTREPVVIAFNSSNLKSIAMQVSRKFISNPIIICGDNDQFTQNNQGLECALSAAKAVNGTICMPSFQEKHFIHKPTDFNDLFCLEGVDEAEKQLCFL